MFEVAFLCSVYCLNKLSMAPIFAFRQSRRATIPRDRVLRATGATWRAANKKGAAKRPRLNFLKHIGCAVQSALGELEGFTGLGFTVFLPFNHTAVAREKACGFQRSAQGRFIKLQRF